MNINPHTFLHGIDLAERCGDEMTQNKKPGRVPQRQLKNFKPKAFCFVTIPEFYYQGNKL